MPVQCLTFAPITAGSAVLIHCTLGVNRGATITIGIVARRLGITVPAAVALVKSKCKDFDIILNHAPRFRQRHHHRAAPCRAVYAALLDIPR